MREGGSDTILSASPANDYRSLAKLYPFSSNALETVTHTTHISQMYSRFTFSFQSLIYLWFLALFALLSGVSRTEHPCPLLEHATDLIVSHSTYIGSSPDTLLPTRHLSHPLKHQVSRITFLRSFTEFVLREKGGYR